MKHKAWPLFTYMALAVILCDAAMERSNAGSVSRVGINQSQKVTSTATALPRNLSSGKLNALKASGLNADLSNVRGFNYNTTSSVDDANGVAYDDQWIRYNHDEVNRDMGYAQRLNLNQARVFLSYNAWLKNKAAFREHLIDFVRTSHAHGVGVMPVLVDGPNEMMPDLFEPSARPQLRAWAVDMVSAIGKEPGLAFWDVANEPDIQPKSPEWLAHRMAIAKYMAGVFRELDPHTPVTVGCAFVPCMEELASSEDVLAFHDYSPTKAEIRQHMQEARAFAAKVGKPVFTTEMACIARANPYDIELQEHMQAGMGWYIWELMIAYHWGPVHGVFYPDGTVRDPSIPAAILGFFRNRGQEIVLEVPDREGWVTRTVASAKDWLADANPDWNAGLRIAEMEANLLEAGQLTSMRELPTRTVDLLRAGKPDIPALQAVVRKFSAILEPYRKVSG